VVYSSGNDERHDLASPWGGSAGESRRAPTTHASDDSRDPAVVVYTDGGAEPNPGVGGWGAVILDPSSGEREISGGDDSTTNNRMELTAAIRALETLHPGRRVDVHTDSTYLRLGITQWLRRWKAAGWRVRGGDAVKNEDLWRDLESASSRHRVRWHWVKGHSGHRHNERAHALAAAEIERRRRPAPRRAAGSTPAGVEVLLKLSCVGGRGAWAARVRRDGVVTTLGGEASEVTANRLELLAAAEVLGALPEEEPIDWRGGSDYLRAGASKWLATWRRRGFRTAGGDPVKNEDVWRRLEGLLLKRRVRFAAAVEDDATALEALEREVERRLGRRRPSIAPARRS
jgi:ribonuclease HI